MLRAVIAHLVAHTSGCTDDGWVVDSTPVECGRSRETTKRCDLAGWAEYGYCASADERDILLGMLDADPNLLATHPAPTLMADKNYYGRQFETALADAGIDLLRPARKGEKPRAGQRFFKPLRQVVRIGQQHPHHPARPRTPRRTHIIAGVAARVLQRILACTAAIWHNDRTDQPILRSLTGIRPLTPRNHSSSPRYMVTSPSAIRSTALRNTSISSNVL
jgi:hypothetical protein